MHVHKCYRTAKGSEIPAYCRVCPEPFLPPYHKKGMFPYLQGTIKLKAVSSLLGEKHLVCKHVQPRQRVPFAGTSLLPYCGCINFLQNPRVDLFQNGLVGPPCSLRDSQESSPTPQFKSINSLVLSFLYSPTLTSIHDHWKNHRLS